MCRKKLCVPAGAFAQLIAGDVPSPGAAPGAAWLNLTGICPPSGNPGIVKVIAVWAVASTANDSSIIAKGRNRMRPSYPGIAEREFHLPLDTIGPEKESRLV